MVARPVGNRASPAYQNFPTDEGDRAWFRGYLDSRDLFRIAAWKSAKGMATLTLNTTDKIEHVTGLVVELLRPYQHADARVLHQSGQEWTVFLDVTETAVSRHTGLQQLDGVGLAMASAILCALNERAWPVIDKWATISLFESKLGPSDWHWTSTYRQYIEATMTLSLSVYKDHSIHEIDLKLMDIGMGKEVPPFARTTLARRTRRTGSQRV